MKKILSKSLAVLMSLILLASAIPFMAGAAAVAPSASVTYSASSPIIDYNTAKTANQYGSFVYGTSCTATYNTAANAIDVSAAAGSNYVIAYYDAPLVLARENYCFTILYKTTSSTLLGATNFNMGYYATSLVATGINTSVRPAYTTQSITIGGESYYMATAVLDNTDAKINVGTKIFGIRFNVVTTGTPYSIYSAGVFGSATDAVDYYTKDSTPPTFPTGASISASFDNGAVVSWTAATDNATAAAAMTYEVYSSSSAITAGNISAASLAATVTGTTSATLSNLVAGNSYYFAVKAIDGDLNEALLTSDTYFTVPSNSVKAVPLAYVDFDADTAIYTAGPATPGSVLTKGATASYDASLDAITATAPGNNNQSFVVYFDEPYTVNAAAVPEFYLAALYESNVNFTDNPGNLGYFMNDYGSDGKVFATPRPGFTDEISVTRSGKTLKLAYAKVTASSYNGKIVGLRVPPYVAGTFSIHSVGLFGSVDEAVALMTDTAVPTLDADEITVSGSDLEWTVAFDAATDNVTPDASIEYNVYASETALSDVAGDSIATVKDATEVELTGLDTETTYYLTLTATDASGNVAKAMNFDTITTGKATAYSYTSFGENTVIASSSADLTYGAFLSNGHAVTYDSTTDTVKITAVNGGNNYVNVYFDKTYDVSTNPSGDYYAAILYQSDKDFVGSGYLLSTYSTSVVNATVGGQETAYRPVFESKAFTVNGTAYKIAYAKIDAAWNGGSIKNISGFRSAGGLGSASGTPFYFYGAGLFSSVASAQAALLDTVAPVFDSEDITATSTYKTVTVDFESATDDVLKDQYISYYLYVNTDVITLDTLSEATFVSALDATSLTVKDLIPDTSYYYAVVAKDAAGNMAILGGEDTVDTYPDGDLNSDGETDAEDLTLIRAYLLGIENGSIDIDVNCDGVSDICDLVYLKKLMAA